MSPPLNLGFLDEGMPKWFTQRPKPFTNCMFAAVCVPLSFMGYKLPDDMVDRLRNASGVERDKPTSTADTRRALKQLIPDCPIQFRTFDDTQMLERIAAGEIVVRVMVRVVDLPHELKKHFKPETRGRHAVALVEAVPHGPADFMVRYLDPMGRPVPGYKGTRILYSKFKDALVRTDGKVQAAVGEKNAAKPENPDEVKRGRMGIFGGNPLMPVVGEPVVLTRGRANEFAHVSAGTPFRHPVTLEVVTRAVEGADFRLAGRSTDGKWAGVWVNTRKIKHARGLTLLIVDRELTDPPFSG